jgi:hypothetical protein
MPAVSAAARNGRSHQERRGSFLDANAMAQAERWIHRDEVWANVKKIPEAIGSVAQATAMSYAAATNGHGQMPLYDEADASNWKIMRLCYSFLEDMSVQKCARMALGAILIVPLVTTPIYGFMLASGG